MEIPAVLIIDDDPSHLRIYGWIVKHAGFESLTTLATVGDLVLPSAHVDLVLLDYHLAGNMKATSVAKLVRETYPDAPILILSDAMMMPDDIGPHVDGFIRKGDPARLVETVTRQLSQIPHGGCLPNG
jgi:CheY-like chemotaxis protein